MGSKTIILVTGANGGIGFELVSQLLSDPSKHVLLGSRSIEKGNAAVAELQSRNQPGSVELLELDVDSSQSVSAAAQQVASKHGRLDALVNNAAIGSLRSTASVGEQLTEAFQTNATGVYLTVEAFATLLQKSNGTPRIINVTSGAGSVARRLDPNSPGYNWGMRGLPYGASKAAMSTATHPTYSKKSTNCSLARIDLITATQAVVYGELGIKVFAFSPGFVASNLGPHNTVANGAQETSVGAAPMVRILNGERDDEIARNGFLRATGQQPW